MFFGNTQSFISDLIFNGKDRYLFTNKRLNTYNATVKRTQRKQFVLTTYVNQLLSIKIPLITKTFNQGIQLMNTFSFDKKSLIIRGFFY